MDQPVQTGTPRLFYDGGCALCHAAVRFTLRRDRSSPALRIAPLGGETCRRELSAELREGLPDSVAVLTPDGGLLVRSRATLWLLRRLGRGWRALAAVAALVPAPLRDRIYDAVARRRRRWFGRTERPCPLLPLELAARFDP